MPKWWRSLAMNFFRAQNKTREIMTCLLSSFFISYCFKLETTLKNDWHLYGGLWRKNIRNFRSDEFIRRCSVKRSTKLTSFCWAIAESLTNQPLMKQFIFSIALKFHVEKFALNKLSSETNGISNPSLAASWHCNSFFLEEGENFHFKRFLSYFHFKKRPQRRYRATADASINLNNQ